MWAELICMIPPSFDFGLFAWVVSLVFRVIRLWVKSWLNALCFVGWFSLFPMLGV